MPYVFTYDLSRQGYNEMIQKLDEHSNNRKDALNKCYNQIRTNYFKLLLFLKMFVMMLEY